MFNVNINFDADDPIFLTGLMAGTVLATLIDDWWLSAIIAGVAIAAVTVVDNEDIVKFAYGFAVSFILSSFARLVRNSLLPQGLSVSQLFPSAQIPV